MAPQERGSNPTLAPPLQVTPRLFCFRPIIWVRFVALRWRALTADRSANLETI